MSRRLIYRLAVLAGDIIISVQLIDCVVAKRLTPSTTTTIRLVHTKVALCSEQEEEGSTILMQNNSHMLLWRATQIAFLTGLETNFPF
jgi:hypothetical protein